MRCSLPAEAQSFPSASSHKIAGRIEARRCFLLNLPSPQTQPLVIAGPGLLIFFVRLIYGKTIMFEVKWLVIGYNLIRRLLEALINSLLN